MFVDPRIRGKCIQISVLKEITVSEQYPVSITANINMSTLRCVQIEVRI